MKIETVDGLYIESYSEVASIKGYLNYWHIDITKLAETLYGSDIVVKFLIISEEHEYISEEEFKGIIHTLTRTWELNEEIYIPNRFCQVAIHLANKRMIAFKYHPNSMTTFSKRFN